MRTRVGKRKSSGADDQEHLLKKTKSNNEEPKSTAGIVSLTESCYRNLAYHLSDYDIDALSCTNKKMRSKMTSDSIWRLRFERRFCREEDEKLKLASNWKQLYKWQCCEMLYSDTSLFGPSKFTIYMDAQMYGIRKTVITNSAVFVLDNSGSVHKWDSDDEFWSPNVLSNVVDIVTDSTDARQHRNSLFVLSQSDRLAGERPKLIDFLKWQKRKTGPNGSGDFEFSDFERKLKHWYPTGAPRSGDRVDVFRVENGNLRRVFKMTFQQAHRFVLLQVSNRDYNKTPSQQNLSDSRGKHINELQLLTTKGRVWSLTVNEPELIANGGGAQVALKNITSRFDSQYSDGNENTQITKLFNGKHLSALLEKSGDLLVFSDKDDEMTNFFSNRTLRKTTIGNDQATTRLSTSINVGCAISDVAISKNHMLIIDIRGRLWSVGRNRNGQLGLCNRTDQSAPKLVPLPLNVKRVLSASTSSTHSVILCEMRNGQVMPYACGALRSQKILGYNIDFDADNITTQSISSGYMTSLTKFCPIEIDLESSYSQVCITNSQIVFLRKNDEQCRNSSEEKNPTTTHIYEHCRHCQVSANGILAYDGMESFKSAMREKTLDWINEQVGMCSCIIGNHAYRTVLIERLVEQREYERGDEFYPIDSDLIIEAIQYAQMIDRQNQPFSLIQ